jgi:hypothetical protein
MAMLVVSPVSRGHYFMLVCPAVIFVPWWLDLRGRFRTAVVLALAPVLLIDMHYALMPFATRVGLLGLGISVWLLAAMAVIARADNPPNSSGDVISAGNIAARLRCIDRLEFYRYETGSFPAIRERASKADRKAEIDFSARRDKETWLGLLGGIGLSACHPNRIHARARRNQRPFPRKRRMAHEGMNSI